MFPHTIGNIHSFISGMHY